MERQEQMTQLYRLKEKKTNTLSLEPVVMRESLPRQVDRESRGPQGKRGLEFSRRKKGQTFFSFSTFLRII